MTSRMSNMTALIIGLAGVAIILKVPRKDIGQARQRISSYSRLGAGAYRSYPESKNMHHSRLNKLKPAFADGKELYAVHEVTLNSGVKAYRREP